MGKFYDVPHSMFLIPSLEVQKVFIMHYQRSIISQLFSNEVTKLIDRLCTSIYEELPKKNFVTLLKEIGKCCMKIKKEICI